MQIVLTSTSDFLDEGDSKDDEDNGQDDWPDDSDDPAEDDEAFVQDSKVDSEDLDTLSNCSSQLYNLHLQQQLVDEWEKLV